MPTDFLQSMYRRRPAHRPLSAEDEQKLSAYRGQVYASMKDEMEKISVAAKLVGPKKKPHTVVQTEPGTMHLTKVGAGFVGRIPRAIRSAGRAFAGTMRSGRARAKSKAIKKRGKGTPSEPGSLGKTLRAGLIGGGIAVGGVGLGAGKVLSQHARQQQQGSIPPFYQ